MVETPDPATARWVHGLAAFGRTFSAIMGTAGLGLLLGLCYGARAASQGPAADELLTMMAWVVCLGLYGAIGFVVGLAVALLGMLLIWIVRLARKIVQAWGKGKVKTP